MKIVFWYFGNFLEENESDVPLNKQCMIIFQSQSISFSHFHVFYPPFGGTAVGREGVKSFKTAEGNPIIFVVEGGGVSTPYTPWRRKFVLQFTTKRLFWLISPSLSLNHWNFYLLIGCTLQFRKRMRDNCPELIWNVSLTMAFWGVDNGQELVLKFIPCVNSFVSSPFCSLSISPSSSSLLFPSLFLALPLQSLKVFLQHPQWLET